MLLLCALTRDRACYLVYRRNALTTELPAQGVYGIVFFRASLVTGVSSSPLHCQPRYNEGAKCNRADNRRSTAGQAAVTWCPLWGWCDTPLGSCKHCHLSANVSKTVRCTDDPQECPRTGRPWRCCRLASTPPQYSESHEFWGFPVHLKVVFIPYCSLLSVQ